jgi:hypothetical protein
MRLKTDAVLVKETGLEANTEKTEDVRRRSIIMCNIDRPGVILSVSRYIE